MEAWEMEMVKWKAWEMEMVEWKAWEMEMVEWAPAWNVSGAHGMLEGEDADLTTLTLPHHSR